MTDKQIIINDVDVLNCGYFSQFEGKTENACYIQPRKVIGSDVNIGFGSCDSSLNCYYKQLKRKEQECFDLLTRANAYNSLVIIANDRLDKIEEKDKEIQELKEKYLELAEQNGNNIVQLNTVNEQLDQLKEKNKWYDHYKESALRNKELYNDLSIKYDQLEAEKKKLKNKIKELLHDCNSCNFHKYKQALQEIKRIAQGYKPYKVCGDYNNNCEPINEILQKCEVIKNE